MSIIKYIRQIDWKDEENRKVADALVADAFEYLKCVEAHVYKGNEIRADSFMSIDEKQDEISRLDRKRTAAHDKMLKSFASFLSMLKEQEDFDETDYRLENRVQKADFVALIAFELMDAAPASKVEGDIRDELAEKIHTGEITFERISELINEKLYQEYFF